MRRPFVWTAAAWMLGELLAEQIDTWAAVCMALLLFFTGAGSTREKEQVIGFLWIAGGFFFGFWSMEHTGNIYESYDRLEEGTKLVFTGSIEEIRKGDYGDQVTLRGKSCSAMVYWDGACGLKIGNRIRVSGEKVDFRIARNEGNFDEKLYDYGRKIAVKIKETEYQLLSGQSEKIRCMLADIRTGLCKNVDEMCREQEAGLLKAILYGEREDLGQEEKRLFQKNGIAHILAVSGLHMSLIGMTLYRLCRKKWSFGISGMIAGSVLCAFGLMAGFGISVRRALCMMLLRMIAEYTGRTYDTASAMGVSCLLILADCPYALYQTAFLLSYSAIATVGVLYPFMEGCVLKEAKRSERKHLRKFYLPFLGSALIWACGLPVIAGTFYELPTYSLLLNLIVLPFMELLFCSGLIASLCMFLSAKIGIFLAGTAVFILKGYYALCRLAEKLPAPYRITGKPSSMKIFLFLAVLMALLIVLKRGTCSPKKKLALSFMGIAILAFVIYAPEKRRQTEISVLDVGQGDCTLIEAANGHNYLVDGGSTDVNKVGTYRLLPYLKYRGVGVLHGIFISHGDADHINGVEELLEDGEIQVERLVLGKCDQFKEPYEKLIALAKKRGVSIMYAKRSEVWKDGELTFQFINPGEEPYEDINESSMVFILKEGNFSMCFTGDIGSETEETLLPLLTTVSVLKTPHHGSKYSSSEEFLRRLSPAAATISCGFGNRYGHPGKETLERMRTLGIRIALTTGSGRIRIIPGKENGDFQMSGFLKPEVF